VSPWTEKAEPRRSAAMAVKAQVIQASDGYFAISLYPGDGREWVGDDPDARAWPFYFSWDAEKLEHGEYDLGGIMVPDVRRITDEWLAELDKLDLPRIDLPEAGLFDVMVSDALRWARQTFPSRYSGVR